MTPYARLFSSSILVFTALLSSLTASGQENTFRLTVLAYEWTTTHKTLTFSWPGSSNTSCNGDTNVNGYVSGTGNFSANASSSDSCYTSYTPPSNQTIDIQKPVVFILADSDTSRMVLTCTRNVRWSQCHSLNPGSFLGRIDKGHFEVQGLSGKGKEEWVRFDVVQQTEIVKQQQPQESPVQEIASSIESPKSEASRDANNAYPTRWKSMVNGSIRTLRFEGEYIYGETIMREDVAKAGAYVLMDVKKAGDKYVGTTNWRLVSGPGGKSCSGTSNIELTLVTPARIEGRTFSPSRDGKIDWDKCTFSPAPDWQPFSWIPVQ